MGQLPKFNIEKEDPIEMWNKTCVLKFNFMGETKILLRKGWDLIDGNLFDDCFSLLTQQL